MEKKSTGQKLIDAGVWVGLAIIVLVALIPVSLVVMDILPHHERVPMNWCQTNLHEIAMAMQLYQQDYRGFPETLGGYVKRDSRGNVIPMERITDRSSLYGEYLKTARGLHCPLCGNTETETIVKVVAGGKTREYYAYDSYDVFYPGEVEPGEPARVGREAVRYKKLGNPSKDTVVTWCSYHRGSSAGNKIPVLFLDGHCDLIPARDVEGENGHGGSRWRTIPNS